MNVRMTLCSIFLLGVATVAAQTTVNPDISAVGDFRLFSHDDPTRPDEQNEFNFADPMLELLVSGYLNPYMSAAGVLAWHDGADAAIEELYATVHRGLPLNLGLRAGKYRLPFGRLNPIHPHAYSFIMTPLPHEMFFGEEGLSDVGVQLSTLLPTGDFYTELMGAALKGEGLLGHGHAHEAEAEHDEERTDIGFFGRLTTSFAPGDASELALGLSALNEVYEVEHDTTGPEEIATQLRAWVVGTDLKYRWVPSRYTTLQIEAEGLMRVEEGHDGGDDLTSYGAYGYLDYRFRQRYNVGGIAEWVRVEHLAATHNTSRYGLFAGFSPVEETAVVRLVGHWTDPDDGASFWQITGQLVFSLGPHKAHNF